MMKKMVGIAAMLLWVGSACFGQQVRLKGNIKGLGNEEFAINYMNGQTMISDTVKAQNGKFTWVANLPGPQKVYFQFEKRVVPLHAESGEITMEGNADSLQRVKITGSKVQDDADAYAEILQPLEKLESAMVPRFRTTDKEARLKVEKEFQDVRRQKFEAAVKYAKEHPDGPYTLILATDHSAMGAYEDVKRIYDSLSDRLKSSANGRALTERMAVLKRSAIGAPILNFTQNDMNGKPVSFSAFAGKYVFVDFWASWCGPCRSENPNVLKAYNKYKDQNFTVVGVSLDDNGENWKKAIREDGMPWAQLSDLKGWENEVSTYYGISAIPSTLLVDPQGKIIARNLRGQLLNEKLAELFGK
ncbi:TlpA disulfide reductase family protein [Parapedobacter tibetensis]|uniref:TlpA disulfide reductase family protein n=1 Tax=Parapedobacter tibetensis TaxID=2972951 RepID=UPI00214D91BD|nr:TlpA disulfide reductase family protein [Parapedobacter tibetensis]